jgi:hypothetical protein
MPELFTLADVHEVQPFANGAAEPMPPTPPPLAPAGPRLPRRESWLELPDEYAGFRVKVWVNYPRRLNDELTSQDAPRVTAALRQIVLEHNDWLDFEGKPLAPAASDEFWRDVPDELAATVLMLLMGQVGKLAASVMPTRAR